MGPWVLLGVALIVFIESGVLFPILPGDSLIFAAGLLHTQLNLNLWLLIGVILLAAFLGAQIGYWLGRRYGRGLFKPDARILKTEHLEQAENYFARYGGRSLILGRFVPIVRTFVPIAAGTARFPFGRFVVFNTLGAAIWGVGVTMIGALLGDRPWVHDNLEIIILLIVLVSVIPMVVEVLVQRRKAKQSD
ncbi:DedA family protein [Actinomyces sp. F1_1611]|uniref:DedA family protein n=2 Tax=Scrofimicrobium appendicitidis TaxID=3079930 RepID=A0AAU7VBZ9_9ACTO